jgi:hypothetical protein
VYNHFLAGTAHDKAREQWCHSGAIEGEAGIAQCLFGTFQRVAEGIRRCGRRREQVNILGGSVSNAVFSDRTGTGQCKTGRSYRLQ